MKKYALSKYRLKFCDNLVKYILSKIVNRVTKNRVDENSNCDFAKKLTSFRLCATSLEKEREKVILFLFFFSLLDSFHVRYR